jgi:hypothetical protein
MERHRAIGLHSDPFDRLDRDIQELRQRLDALKANSRPTIPTYTPSVIADLSTEFNDGEFWINTNNGSCYYYFEGATLRVATV